MNESFLELFGYDRGAIVGTSLNDLIVPEWLSEEATELDEETATGNVTYQRVVRETRSGLREFLYRGIPIDESSESRIDGIAIYTDISEIARQERRLQVLNRILRHNLRNEANVVVGNTSRLLEEIGDEDTNLAAIATDIEHAAEKLEKLTYEARDIQRILSSDSGDRTDTDLISIINEVIAEHRDSYPSAKVQLEAPNSAIVRANEDIRFAFDSLIENAITHNDSDIPQVQFALDKAITANWITIAIEDNGPLIPKQEIEVVTGESDITALEHGSGLGLWLAKWTVNHFGGQLSFDESKLGGNRVEIRLPSANPE
jgi:PAS domain S-box-containing protein